MIFTRATLLIAAAVVVANIPGRAAERGNPEAGRALVSRTCAMCHAVGGASTQSDAAPPLSFMARVNKERPAWIRGWLMSPHSPMPNIMLSRQEINDVIAYLQTLPVDTGDTNKGEMFARAVCAQCHAVGKGQRNSPNRAAPSFSDIAASPGLSATAVRVWLQSPHPTMPNISLANEDKDNVITYLLSLKNG